MGLAWVSTKASKALYYPKVFAAQSQEIFALLQTLTLSALINEQGITLPRKTGWYVSNSCACPYKYSHQPVEAQAMPSWLEQIMVKVQQVCNPDGPTFNSCNINLYTDGTQSCGMHHDNEKLFNAIKAPACIASLSLGQTRQFTVRNVATGTWTNKDLHNGDLCTMEGLFQKEFVHGALAQPHLTEARFNLTFRTIVTLNPVCRHSKEAMMSANSN